MIPPRLARLVCLFEPTPSSDSRGTAAAKRLEAEEARLTGAIAALERAAADACAAIDSAAAKARAEFSVVASTSRAHTPERGAEAAGPSSSPPVGKAATDQEAAVGERRIPTGDRQSPAEARGSGDGETQVLAHNAKVRHPCRSEPLHVAQFPAAPLLLTPTPSCRPLPPCAQHMIAEQSALAAELRSIREMLERPVRATEEPRTGSGGHGQSSDPKVRKIAMCCEAQRMVSDEGPSNSVLRLAVCVPGGRAGKWLQVAARLADDARWHRGRRGCICGVQITRANNRRRRHSSSSSRHRNDATTSKHQQQAPRWHWR